LLGGLAAHTVFIYLFFSFFKFNNEMLIVFIFILKHLNYI